MADIKSIGEAKGKEEKCPYCGLVPTSAHPDFTCPRLSAASWGGEGTAVEFVDPEKWEIMKARITSGSG